MRYTATWSNISRVITKVDAFAVGVLCSGVVLSGVSDTGVLLYKPPIITKESMQGTVIMSEKNPWTTLSSREVYSNEWLRLREDEVLRPNGSPGIYSVVETRVAAGVVVLTPAREIVLVGQYRYPTEVYSWEIIAGGTDEGEAPLEAAKRELGEEAGLIAHTWHHVGVDLQMSNCITAEIGQIYIAQDLEETDLAPDETEELRLKRIPFAEAVAQVERGEITDAFSVMGILLTQRWLGGQ